MDETVGNEQVRRSRFATKFETRQLTPTEVDVARLVQEGLSNKEIGARLFISPRTVQTHHTHVYTKLGLASRMQLAREAARGHPTQGLQAIHLTRHAGMF